MNAIFFLGLISTLVSASAFAKKVDCHQFDNTKLGGTYYEAEISDKNEIKDLKVIDVTGGISTVLSTNKGPFKGQLNSNAKNSMWRSYMKYTNVNGGDCKSRSMRFFSFTT